MTWLIGKRFGDFVVTRRFRFRSDLGVKKSLNVCDQISRGHGSKQEPLRQHTPRRVNANPLSLALPPFESRWHIGINFAFQLPAGIALLPNFSLKCFQRRALAVSRD